VNVPADLSASNWGGKEGGGGGLHWFTLRNL